MKYLYAVEMQLAGNSTDYRLCECDTIAAACEVARVLLEHSRDKPTHVTIRVVPLLT